MAKIAVIYFSNTCVTECLAEAAISAIEDAGCDVFVHAIRGSEIYEGRFVNLAILSEINSSDAIIFASPTYMGSVAAQFKAFADATGEVWSRQGWAGKFAAGITCGAALNGDQASTLQYLSLFASQQGMLWVGLDIAFGHNERGINRLGCQLGVVSQAMGHQVNEVDIESARYLAARVANLVLNKKSY